MEFMFDSVEASALPNNTEAFAGYVNGRFPSFAPMVARFPHVVANHRALSITITAAQIAMCLDVENGDALPSQAGAWVTRALAAQVWKPCLYASRSAMPAVVADVQAHGHKREAVRLWLATDSGKPIIPPGYDANQYLFGNTHIGNSDHSIIRDDFFPAIVPRHPTTHLVAAAHVTYDHTTGHWTVAGTPFEKVGS
jgi:hypothetical protein